MNPEELKTQMILLSQEVRGQRQAEVYDPPLLDYSST